MPFSLYSFILLIAAVVATPAVMAQTPSPGDYVMPPDGSLSVKVSKDGASTFEIGVTGSNAHYCSLKGKIKDNIGYAESEDASDPQCSILFTSEQSGLKVSITTGSACGDFCGMNVWFEGTYIPLPTGCSSSELKTTRESFTTAYRSKDYSHAYDTLSSMFHQCRNFLDWKEIDSVRNDLAVTQYHLGHQEECIGILKDTIGATQTNIEKLKSSLPPSDFEYYLPVAKATWYNLKICGKVAGKAPRAQ